MVGADDECIERRPGDHYQQRHAPPQRLRDDFGIGALHGPVAIGRVEEQDDDRHQPHQVVGPDHLRSGQDDLGQLEQ